MLTMSIFVHFVHLLNKRGSVLLANLALFSGCIEKKFGSIEKKYLYLLCCIST